MSPSLLSKNVGFKAWYFSPLILWVLGGVRNICHFRCRAPFDNFPFLRPSSCIIFKTSNVFYVKSIGDHLTGSYPLELVCFQKRQKNVPDQLLVCGIGDLWRFWMVPLWPAWGAAESKSCWRWLWKKTLVRFISNFDISFYSWVLLKSKSRGF